MTDPATLALLAWLLPGGVFLLLAVVLPLRRAGRLAGWVSILAAAGALAAAIQAWRASSVEHFSRIRWPWIPTEAGPLTHIGVLADSDSTLMLVLVAGVAFLVQLYSMGYLSDEPRPSLRSEERRVGNDGTCRRSARRRIAN